MESPLHAEKKLPYPKSVFFIVSNEFCERFSYYGMRTILSLYLTNILLFSESDAKIVYHTFTMLVYFFPLCGAILSDSYLGKFRTILYVSIIYAAGNIILSMAATDPIGLPQKPFSIIGLLLIAIGTGGIKPCVSAFGGDQFQLPQQEIQLAAFFSMFYFAINAGSLISTFLTPVLREDVHCFGNESCYPLAFAVPGVLMIISIVIFGAGKPLYKIRKPEGNIVVKVTSCIWYAFKSKIRSSAPVAHWLDYAVPQYGEKLVYDVKATLKVLVLYIPLPIFWALYDQQGTGWTFQAVRMNGDIGFYTILPDQMQVVNPLLILLFIPLFTYGLYPTLAKCHILETPLQRMVCGGFITATAFAISACVSLGLESTYPVLPTAGNAQIRFYNTLKCDAVIDTNLEQYTLSPFDYKVITIDATGNKSFEINNVRGCETLYNGPKKFSFVVPEADATGFFITSNNIEYSRDKIAKSENGLPRVRTIVDKGADNISIEYVKDNSERIVVPSTNHSLFSINPGSYQIKNSDVELKFALGGIYTILVNLVDGQPKSVKLLTVTQPNSVHILWLLPQYIVITAGEIMFSITGLEFSYSQAPTSMKSVLTAAFLLTTAIGNLVIVIIESAKIFEKQSSDFFLYTALMVLDMIVFAFMCLKYKYIEPNKDEHKVNGDDNTDSNTLKNTLDRSDVQSRYEYENDKL